jgi:hypothetical protein
VSLSSCCSAAALAACASARAFCCRARSALTDSTWGRGGNWWAWVGYGCGCGWRDNKDTSLCTVVCLCAIVARLLLSTRLVSRHLGCNQAGQGCLHQGTPWHSSLGHMRNIPGQNHSLAALSLPLTVIRSQQTPHYMQQASA